MTPEAFSKFMKQEQKEDFSIEEYQRKILDFESSDDKTSFSKEGFTHFLMFNDWQELVSPNAKNKIDFEQMKYPLSHYWIASSHNTYETLLLL